MQQFNLRDESGDKKYFTQIPNMIVNYSTAYEQSLYLIMKRLAGEHGTCFASINFFREKMGVAKRTVNLTIKKLLKRNWIKEIKSKKVQGGMVRQFIIIDLWKLNIEQYESGTHVTTSKLEVEPTCTRSGTSISRSGTHVTPKKNYKKNYKEEAETFKKNFQKEERLVSLETLNKIRKSLIEKKVIHY